MSVKRFIWVHQNEVGRFDLTQHLPDVDKPGTTIDWLIASSNTQIGEHDPRMSSVRELKNQCLVYGIPFWFHKAGNELNPAVYERGGVAGKWTEDWGVFR